MKILYGITGSLCVALFLSGIVSAKDPSPVAKCYKCGEDESKCGDPVDKTQLVEETCGEAPPEATTAAAAAGAEETTAAPAARRRRQDDAAAAGDAAATTAAAGPVTIPKPPDGWVCLKSVGKDKTVRKCGANCDEIKVILPDGSCVACETDLCNSSIRYKPMFEWMFLLIALICIGLDF